MLDSKLATEQLIISEQDHQTILDKEKKADKKAKKGKFSKLN